MGGRGRKWFAPIPVQASPVFTRRRNSGDAQRQPRRYVADASECIGLTFYRACAEDTPSRSQSPGSPGKPGFVPDAMLEFQRQPMMVPSQGATSNSSSKRHQFLDFYRLNDPERAKMSDIELENHVDHMLVP